MSDIREVPAPAPPEPKVQSEPPPEPRGQSEPPPEPVALAEPPASPEPPELREQFESPSENKVLNYLLNESKSEGKDYVFKSHGFSENNWQELANKLYEHAMENPTVGDSIRSPWGEKIIKEGSIMTPSGKELYLRTVWIRENEDGSFRLVTAYPLEKPE